MRSIALVLLASATVLSQSALGADSSPFAQTRRLMEQGKYDDAISRLQELSSREPILKGLSHELGTAYYKKGDYIKAIDSFKKALEENSQDNEAVQLLGLTSNGVLSSNVALKSEPMATSFDGIEMNTQPLL